MSWLRDLCLIVLAVEAFVLALVPLLLLGGLVYGLLRLQRHENLPTWLQLAQAYLALAQAYVELAMRTVLRPILWIHSVLATVQGWLGAVAKLGGEK
jgi:hypothetical protein